MKQFFKSTNFVGITFIVIILLIVFIRINYSDRITAFQNGEEYPYPPEIQIIWNNGNDAIPATGKTTTVLIEWVGSTVYLTEID